MANKTIVDLETDLVKPYIDKVETRLNDNIKYNGAKNILANFTAGGALGGIQFAKQDDGSFILNGTATGNPSSIDLFAGGKYGTAGSSFPSEELKFKSVEELGIDLSKTYVLSIGNASDNIVRLNFLLYDKSLTVLQTFTVRKSSPDVEIDFSDYPTTYYLRTDLAIGTTMVVTNATAYPSLMLKSDYEADPSYQPFAEPNVALTHTKAPWTALAQVGTVNILPSEGEASAVNNGITYTKNADGSVTLSGTATAQSSYIVSREFYVGTDNLFKLRGAPKEKNVFLRLTAGGSSTNIAQTDNLSQEVTYQATTDTVGVRIMVSEGTDLTTPVTVYPMVTAVEYEGEYIPYHASNGQLTERVETLEERIGKLGTLSAYDIGNVKQATKTITITGSARFLLLATHADNVNKQYMSLGVHPANAIPTLTPILTATEITIATGTDTVSVTNPDNNNVAVQVLVLAGNPTITWA